MASHVRLPASRVLALARDVKKRRIKHLRSLRNMYLRQFRKESNWWRKWTFRKPRRRKSAMVAMILKHPSTKTYVFHDLDYFVLLTDRLMTASYEVMSTTIDQDQRYVMIDVEELYLLTQY